MTTPRMRVLDRAEVVPEVRTVFDDFMAKRGNIPNLFRTLARRPEIMRTLAAHLAAVLNTGTVDVRLKEMCIVRVSQINDCAY